MKKTKYLRKNGRSRFSKEYSLRGKLHPEAVIYCVRTASGITLIALVVTIIILLILAGVSLKLIAGGNGILGKAEKAVNLTNEAAAREKLELVLVELQADKYIDETYNEVQYIDDRINASDMSITGDIVIVDGWKFQIDRSKPEIVDSLGKGTEIQNIQIESSANCVAPFTQATITYVITYDGELASIRINGENVEIPQPVETENGKQYTITKQVTKNGDYKIFVTDANDGYKIADVKVRDIIGDLDIWTIEDLVAFRDKVNQGATYEGYTVRLMADLDLSSVCGNGIGNWTPIGNRADDNTLYFGGNFEGNGKTINNLYINNSKSQQGLFGNVKNGEIKNLNVNGSVTGGEWSGRNCWNNLWSNELYN